jgi:hypothetical protein
VLRKKKILAFMKKKKKKIMGQSFGKIFTLGTTAAATSLPYSTASSEIITKPYTEDQLTLHQLLCEEKAVNDAGIPYCDLGTTYHEKIVQTSDATKWGKNTAKTKGRKSGGKKAADKERLNNLLQRVNTEREERLTKKLYYFIDASTSDEQVLKEVMNDHLDLFKQLRGIIDSSTKQEESLKEEKLKEILEPTLKTFTMHILRHDYQFVNATLNEDNLRLQKNSIENAINKLNPVKKSEKLYGTDEVTNFQSNILTEINRDSLKWYNNEGDTELGGKNIIQFLRNATKDYVGVLVGEQNILRAAIIDISLDGKKIRNQTKSAKIRAEGIVDSKNPVEIAIIDRFKKYVKTEIKTEIKRANNNSSKLRLKELYALLGRVVGNADDIQTMIIDDVYLLWSIFDKKSEAKFKQSAQETDQQKMSNLFEWVKGEIDYDATLNKLNFYQGKDEGIQGIMKWISLIVYSFIFSKVALAILNLKWLKSGNGASEPASQEPTKGNDKYRPAIKARSDDELIEVFKGDRGRLYIINETSNLRGQYYYRKISTGAHSYRGALADPYLYWELRNTKQTIIKNAKGKPAPVGTIDTDGELKWN